MLTLEERLKKVSEYEEEGFDSDLIESLLQADDGEVRTFDDFDEFKQWCEQNQKSDTDGSDTDEKDSTNSKV